jgi:hypothetical protein
VILTLFTSNIHDIYCITPLQVSQAVLASTGVSRRQPWTMIILVVLFHNNYCRPFLGYQSKPHIVYHQHRRYSLSTSTISSRKTELGLKYHSIVSFPYQSPRVTVQVQTIKYLIHYLNSCFTQFWFTPSSKADG